MPGKGFAAMSPERLREISSKGGKTTQRRSAQHRFTGESARRAGKLSRGIPRPNRRKPAKNGGAVQ